MFGNAHQQYGNFAKNTRGGWKGNGTASYCGPAVGGVGGERAEKEYYLLKTASYTIFWEDGNQIISYVLVVIT